MAPSRRWDLLSPIVPATRFAAQPTLVALEPHVVTELIAVARVTPVVLMVSLWLRDQPAVAWLAVVWPALPAAKDLPSAATLLACEPTILPAPLRLVLPLAAWPSLRSEFDRPMASLPQPVPAPPDCVPDWPPDPPDSSSQGPAAPPSSDPALSGPWGCSLDSPAPHHRDCGPTE